MLWLTTIVMGNLAAWNAREARSLLYPPAVFCGIWTLLLAGVAVSGDSLRPIAPSTLAIYICAALALSGGSLIALMRRRVRAKPALGAYSPACPWSQHILTFSIPFYLSVFPFYVSYIQALAKRSGYPTFWRGVRAMALSINAGADPFPFQTFLFGNLVTLIMLLSLVAFWERDSSRFHNIRAFVLLGIALVFSLMSGSSAGSAMLLLAAVGMEGIRRKKLPWKTLIVSALLFAIIFGVVAVVLEKGHARPYYSVGENLSAVTELFQMYGLGGLVGFDRIVQSPGSVQPTWSMGRFFLRLANRLGAHYEIPALHAEYTRVTRNLDTNVYTMYFAYYPDYGLTGTLLLMLLLGWILGAVYGKALDGSSIAAIIYGIFFSAILLSGYNESFFLALSFQLKLLLVCVGLYIVMPRLTGWRLSGDEHTEPQGSRPDRGQERAEREISSAPAYSAPRGPRD